MKKTINSKELVSIVSKTERAEITQEHLKYVLDLFIRIVFQYLRMGYRVKINKLGIFERKKRKGRRCVSPKDKKTPIFVKSVDVVKFKPSFTLKNFIKK